MNIAQGKRVSRDTLGNSQPKEFYATRRGSRKDFRFDGIPGRLPWAIMFHAYSVKKLGLKSQGIGI